MVYKVKNPETGRSIKKGGKIYKDLEKKKEITGKEKTIRRRKFKPILDKDTPEKISVNKSFHVDRDGDWEKKKPKTIKERKTLHEKCGDDAFLLPKHLKFPICNKVKRKNHKCTYNCSGLKGASSRAGEWGYKKVLHNSKDLTSKLGCYKKDEKKKKVPSEKMKPLKKENFFTRILSLFN